MIFRLLPSVKKTTRRKFRRVVFHIVGKFVGFGEGFSAIDKDKRRFFPPTHLKSIQERQRFSTKGFLSHVCPAGGPKMATGGGDVFSYSSVSSSACHRFIFASLGIRLVVTKSACLCFPLCGMQRPLPCSSSPHRGFCPAGDPRKWRLAGETYFLIPAYPAPPATDSSSHRWASASRRGGTWPRCPPWDRPADSCA